MFNACPQAAAFQLSYIAKSPAAPVNVDLVGLVFYMNCHPFLDRLWQVLCYGFAASVWGALLYFMVAALGCR
jgi:hypothetical protein